MFNRRKEQNSSKLFGSHEEYSPEKLKGQITGGYHL